MKLIAGSAICLTIIISVMSCKTTYKATDFSVNDVNSVTETWPANTKDASNVLISKFGVPDEVTSSTLIWKNRGVWKKTVLMRNEIPHDFPMPHTDYLMQTINYKVPVEKYDDLARYDGSVIVERTKGTLSARCDKEEMNFLALNLAHDIITGKKTVEEARDFYAKTAMKFKDGGTDPYTQQLQFSIPEGDTGYKDVPAKMMK